MIKIVSITLRNFLSIGAQTQSVHLSGDDFTLIMGENVDVSDGRNGAGKSTILQAISYGLYGKPLTKIKIPNLVNNINGKHMSVSVVFEKDNTVYRIERGQKPAFLHFFVGDKELKTEDDEAQGENKHTQAEIVRILGMSHNMFKHIVALNTFTEPFLKMSIADQRSIIEELLGVNLISERVEVLKKLVSTTKDSIRDQESYIKATTETNSRIQNTINGLLNQSDDWEMTQKKIIEKLENDIESLKSIDFEKEIILFEDLDKHKQETFKIENNIEYHVRENARLISDLTRYQKEKTYNTFNDFQHYGRQENDIARKNKDISKLQSDSAELLAKIEDIEAQLANPDDKTCSCCNQPLTGTEHLQEVISNLQNQLTDYDQQFSKNAALILEYEIEINTIMSDIAFLKEEHSKKKILNETRIFEIEKNISDIQDNITKNENILKELRASKSSLIQPKMMFTTLEELYSTREMFQTISYDLENEMSKQNPYLLQIEGLSNSLHDIDYGKLNEFQNLLKHQEFLMKLLTSKDSFIRKKIIDQNLYYLNSRLNHYLETLCLPHEVVFMSDLSVEITKLGREMDFEQLSRGEGNRVIMALAWSFRDVWESLNNPINLLIIDELLDNGLDSSGVETAITTLKNISRRGKNVFLISHREELLASVPVVLTVRKENDFTSFELDK